MSFVSLFGSWKTRYALPSTRPVRLTLESLEERCVLSASIDWSTMPAPNLAPEWLARNAQLRSTPMGNPRVVFLGDSITEWFANGQGASVWQSQIVPLGAVDLGIHGNMTQNVLWQINQGELHGLSPKVVVLMIGTNNLADGETPAHTAGGVQAVVADVRAHLPSATILLMGLPPARQGPNDPLRLEIAQTNALISQLDGHSHVHFLNIGGVFLQPDGTISSSVMFDYVHPTTLGYSLFASALAQPLHQLLADVPAAPSLPAPSPAPIQQPPVAAPVAPVTATPVSSTLPASDTIDWVMILTADQANLKQHG